MCTDWAATMSMTDKQKLEALRRYAKVVSRNRTLEAADNEGIRQWQKGRAAAAKYFLKIIEADEEEE